MVLAWKHCKRWRQVGGNQEWMQWNVKASHSSSEENTDELKKQQSKQEGKKKRTYEQKFCNAWLSNANFKGWIQETKGTNGNSVPYCKVCKVKLSCSKTALTRHMKGKGHTEACEMTAELRKWHLNIGELLGATDKSVAKLEIKLCSFIVEHVRWWKNWHNFQSYSGMLWAERYSNGEYNRVLCRHL